MKIANILTYPHQSLLNKTTDITIFDDSLQALNTLLIDTLKYEECNYLAANQIGINQNIGVILCEDGEIITMINLDKGLDLEQESLPFITASPSYPGVEITAYPPHFLKVTYKTLTGTEETRDFTGLDAIHTELLSRTLAGTPLFNDLSPLQQTRIKKKIQKFLKTHQRHVHSAACNH